jgi:hypothetical protein
MQVLLSSPLLTALVSNEQNEFRGDACIDPHASGLLALMSSGGYLHDVASTSIDGHINI